MFAIYRHRTWDPRYIYITRPYVLLYKVCMYTPQHMGSASVTLWTHKLLIYLGDNMNVVAWLGGTPPRNPFIRHLKRVWRMLMVRGSFGLIEGYVRTYHNTTNDMLTRATREAIEKETARLGLTRIECDAA